MLRVNTVQSSLQKAGALQPVELDQDEDHHRHDPEDLGDGVAGDVEVSGRRDAGCLLGGLASKQ